MLVIAVNRVLVLLLRLFYPTLNFGPNASLPLLPHAVSMPFARLPLQLLQKLLKVAAPFRLSLLLSGFVLFGLFCFELFAN